MKYTITQEEINNLQLEEVDGEEISKTQRKRNIQVLHKLGGVLEALSKKNLKKVNLPEDILHALIEAKRMQSDNAKKRQFQYIAKMLHQVDVQIIFKSYLEVSEPGNKNQKEFMQLERLRDQIISNGDREIGNVIERYPNADRQVLRQYIRGIQKGNSEQTSSIQQRKLFKYLRELSQI